MIIKNDFEDAIKNFEKLALKAAESDGIIAKENNLVEVNTAIDGEVVF